MLQALKIARHVLCFDLHIHFTYLSHVFTDPRSMRPNVRPRSLPRQRVLQQQVAA